MNGLRLYLRYAAASVRSQMEYRTSFVLQSLGNGLMTGIEFAGVWALFHRFGQLRGWTLAEAALFYGAINVAWAIAEAVSRAFDLFGNMVKTGDFDRLLVRPRSTVLQLFGQELTLRKVGRLAQGAAVLGWAVWALPAAQTPESAALLLLAIAGAVCLFIGLVIFQATSAFWTTESLEVWNAFTYGGVLMSQYPVTIYRRRFREFFTYTIPLACVNYFPMVAVLGKTDPLGSTRLLQWLAPLAGVAFLAVSLQVWQFGVRHYRSTGS